MTCQFILHNYPKNFIINLHQVSSHANISLEPLVRVHHSPTVTLSPIVVGNTFPVRLDFATCTRVLSCILVPAPTMMLLTSPMQKMGICRTVSRINYKYISKSLYPAKQFRLMISAVHSLVWVVVTLESSRKKRQSFLIHLLHGRLRWTLDFKWCHYREAKLYIQTIE